jgi:hypothetical protein
MAERYDRARARVPNPFRLALEGLAAFVSACAIDGWHAPMVLDGCIEGRPVRVLVGATGGDMHVSVSRTDARRGKVGRSLPSWEDLVSIRACCWLDNVEVTQVLPALEGDDGEDWLNLAEVLHLRGPLVAVGQ